MSDSSISSSAPQRSPFPRRVSILFLLIIDTVLALMFFFRLKPETPLVMLNIFADLTLGLVAGFGTRIFLRNRGALVRFFAGTAAIIVGLLALGLLTNWQVGFGPLKFWRNTIDWIGLAQISISTVTFLLAMQAWAKPVRVSASSTPAATPAREPIRTREKRKKLKQPAAPVTFPKGKPAQANKATPKSFFSTKQVSKPVTRPKRSLFRRKPAVHLSKIERHLCPYCLEPVTRNDPRGVWECDICHTLHHGDCFAIAGACQVPHYTS